MKYFSWLFLFVFFNSLSLFSQEKYTRHTVSKGETISKIAHHYKVSPQAIYELNPDAVNGIQLKSILLIPSIAEKTAISISKTSNNSFENTHEVLSKETIYGITKQYHISIDELYHLNPNLEKEGLKIGQIITIAQKQLDNSSLKETNKTPVSQKNGTINEIAVLSQKNVKIEAAPEVVVRTVLPKESYYSIAKEYKISIADLQRANPNLGNKSLKVGQKITIPVSSDSDAAIAMENKKLKIEKNTISETYQDQKAQQLVLTVNQETVKNSSDENAIDYVVLPKETYYSIAKKNNITVAILQRANPSLENRALKSGQKIIIPLKTDNNVTLLSENKNTILSENKNTIKEKQTTSDNYQDKQKQILESSLPIVENSIKINEYTREVLPKETKYGIAKEYEISVDELEKQNPSIAKKLIVGTKLKIRSSKLIESLMGNDEVAVKQEVLKTNINNNKSLDNPVLIDQLIQTASDNIGSRYRSGGTTKDGFDCSGLICSTFGTFDIKLPRTSMGMSGYGTVVSTQEAQKGDLIFFKTSRKKQINHVGMVVEVLDGEIKFIHSATRGGVMISSMKESYYDKNFAQINRVLN